MSDGGGVRLDKWLWYARFFKTRSLATKLVASGKLRVNREHNSKAHYSVKAGDVLTFPQGHEIRVVRVLALGERRGPASEARLLYEDLAPPALRPKAAAETGRPAAVAVREPGSGRPTKADRRAIDKLRDAD